MAKLDDLIKTCKILFAFIPFVLTDITTFNGKTFIREKKTVFISDNNLGHLGTLERSSHSECVIACLNTKRCGHTNVKQMTETTFICDLLEWVIGEKSHMDDADHYYVREPCEIGLYAPYSYNGSMYCFYPGPLSWWDAELKCQEHGAYLAAIETEEEQHALQSYLRRHGTGDMNIGLRRDEDTGIYHWSGLSDTVTYFSWAGVNPGERDGESCVMLSNYWHNDYNWADWYCSVRNGFICEHKDN
ncbi:unnamed protein product [Owenia fusiformis]|uniref:Uncharacterized protein n=1 Tax=Owenia fusiformis TaxID=6347 RepID=A0A8J1USS1_OWEFU|nr:unnamed protein product [Owenia fusiformis]